jgi:hypothetical protein
MDNHAASAPRELSAKIVQHHQVVGALQDMLNLRHDGKRLTRPGASRSLPAG